MPPPPPHSIPQVEKMTQHAYSSTATSRMREAQVRGRHGGDRVSHDLSLQPSGIVAGSSTQHAHRKATKGNKTTKREEGGGAGQREEESKNEGGGGGLTDSNLSGLLVLDEPLDHPII